MFWLELERQRVHARLCATYTAPAGTQIAGFHGRAGSEVDKLGVIFTAR